MKTAPDEEFLREKIILLVRISGAMRSDKISTLKFEDINLNEDGIKITIERRKTDQPGEGFEFFVMPSEIQYKNILFYLNKYKGLIKETTGIFFRQMKKKQ